MKTYILFLLLCLSSVNMMAQDVISQKTAQDVESKRTYKKKYVKQKSNKQHVDNKNKALSTENNDSSTSENIFQDLVEQMPSFPGGKDALNEWLKQNTRHIAGEDDVQGRVFVQFVVCKDGTISKAKVIRGIDPMLDEEALRVVNSMPKWVPGKQNGKEVNVMYILPIAFYFR